MNAEFSPSDGILKEMGNRLGSVADISPPSTHGPLWIFPAGGGRFSIL